MVSENGFNLASIREHIKGFQSGKEKLIISDEYNCEYSNHYVFKIAGNLREIKLPYTRDFLSYVFGKHNIENDIFTKATIISRDFYREYEITPLIFEENTFVAKKISSLWLEFEYNTIKKNVPLDPDFAPFINGLKDVLFVADLIDASYNKIISEMSEKEKKAALTLHCEPR